jgi:predicted metal-dependent hydrolase
LSRRIPKRPLSCINLTTLVPFELTADELVHLEHGIALFICEKVWHAHEAGEEIWKNHPEDGRFFLQGLIQLAAASHQLGKKVYRGVVIHLKQAQARLRLFPPDFLGIAVPPILQVIDDSLAAIELRSSLAEVDWVGLKVAKIQRC